MSYVLKALRGFPGCSWSDVHSRAICESLQTETITLYGRRRRGRSGDTRPEWTGNAMGIFTLAASMMTPELR